MERPFLYHSIVQLEQEFEAKKADREALVVLLNELQHRGVKRAVKLRADVAMRVIHLIGQATPTATASTPASSTATPLPTGTPSQSYATSVRGVRLFPWQEEAYLRWKARGRRGIVEAVTGAGKTMVGLVAIGDHLAAGGKATVVVPTVQLLEQWHRSLSRFFPGLFVGRLGGGFDDRPETCEILVATVQSGYRYRIAARGVASLIVADEVHRLGADRFSEALEPEFSYRLGLSATWERPDGKHEEILLPYFGGVIFTLDYVRARREEVISPFDVALVGVDLTGPERTVYDEASSRASRLKKRLVNAYGAPDEPIAAFNAWVSAAKAGKFPQGQKEAGIYLSAVAAKRDALAEASNKIACVEALAAAVKVSDRTLAFTMTIASAQRVAASWCRKGVKSAAYHSEMEQVARRKVFGDFEDGKIKAIVAPKVLDEGVDVPEADMAILVATSRSRVQLVQRIGRVLRKKAHGRRARVVLLYAVQTSEDPDREAHAEALADIELAADAIERFRYPLEGDLLLDFLTDQ